MQSKSMRLRLNCCTAQLKWSDALCNLVAHLGAAGYTAIAADVGSMARMVTRTSKVSGSEDDSRPVAAPWAQGLQSLDKQTTPFAIRLASQAVRLVAITCIALRGEHFAAFAARRSRATRVLCQQ